MCRFKAWFFMAVALFGLLFASESRLVAGEGRNLLYVPTPQSVVNRMLEVAQVTEEDVVYDLGCGDGRFVITAAKEFGATGVGVDLDPERVQESRKNAREAGVTDDVEFKKQDLFKTTIGDASVVVLYLLPETMNLLRSKVLDELKPGTRVVSHDFDFNEWEPDREIRAGTVASNPTGLGESGLADDEKYDFDPTQTSPTVTDIDSELNRVHRIYYWVVPAQIPSQLTWRSPTSEGIRHVTADIDQRFQELTGRLSWDGSETASISRGRVNGRDVYFEVQRAFEGEPATFRYYGRFRNGEIRGSVMILQDGEKTIRQNRWVARIAE